MDQGLDGVNYRVRLDRDDERLDRKEGVLDGRRRNDFRFGVEATDRCIFENGDADETGCLSLLVPELSPSLEDLRPEGRRHVHRALPLDLEPVPRQVRFLQLLRVFVYEHDAMFGAFEGLAKMVGEERADWTETEDMEAHWPARVSGVAGARLYS